MTWSRWVGLGVVLLAVLVSLARFLSGTPSLDALFRVIVWVLLWTTIKGALLRFLDGLRPYRSALAATAVSELIALGFPLSPLGLPWRALGASLLLSTGSEGLTFGALRTASSWNRSFGLALYVNVFVHLLMAGAFLYWPGELAIVRQPLLGGTIIVASFLVFILPIFVVSRGPTADLSRR